MKTHTGGYLDIDRNAGGCHDKKPVENIRWANKKSTPDEGKY